MSMDIRDGIKAGLQKAVQASGNKSKPLIQPTKQNTGDAVTHLKQNATQNIPKALEQFHNALVKTRDTLQNAGKSLLGKNSSVLNKTGNILNNAASFISKGDNKIQQADYQNKLEQWAGGFSGHLVQTGILENNAEEIKNGFLKMPPEQLNFSYTLYKESQDLKKDLKNNVPTFTSEGLGNFEKMTQNHYQETIQRLKLPQLPSDRAIDLMFFFHNQDMLNIIKNEKTNRSQGTKTEIPKTENKDNQIIQSGLEKLLNFPSIEKVLDKGKLQDFLQSNRELTPEILKTMVVGNKNRLLLATHPDKITTTNEKMPENQKFTKDEMTLITKMINNIEN